MFEEMTQHPVTTIVMIIVLDAVVLRLSNKRHLIIKWMLVGVRACAKSHLT